VNPFVLVKRFDSGYPVFTLFFKGVLAAVGGNFHFVFVGNQLQDAIVQNALLGFYQNYATLISASGCGVVAKNATSDNCDCRENKNRFEHTLSLCKN
jgi:hypothetical protein